MKKQEQKNNGFEDNILNEFDYIDSELLRSGDIRNVVDKYRFWENDKIKKDMAKNARPFEIAVENLQRDFNVGSIIRTANAFAAQAVHIVGRRSVNRRGAMVTDKYLNMNYFPTVSDLADYCKKKGILVIGVDILQGISKPIENFVFPKNCVLLFGSESNGLSEEAQAICQTIVHITQFGSTRSINVGAAAAIAMFALSRQI